MRVAFSNRAPGSAVFTGAMPTMASSQISVDGARPSAQDFAVLVYSAVHETQHTVTTFRLVFASRWSASSSTGSCTSRMTSSSRRKPPTGARRSPSRELDQHAQDEAFEI